MVLSLEKITVLCWNAGFPRLKEQAGATVHAVAGGWPVPGIASQLSIFIS